MAPWLNVEAELKAHTADPTLYLGGDGLRPYATWATEKDIHLSFVARTELRLPPLVEELLGGTYGPPFVHRSDGAVSTLRLESSPGIRRRLSVPRLLLIGLGDAERYRGARLALGIARLGQWLRFTHSAHVTVVDYNITDKPLKTITAMLATSRFDVVGISVNFGQWHMLEELAPVVNKHGPEVVVLGNILAAYSSAEAASMFDAVHSDSVLVATTLGERPLETLCRNLHGRDTWARIPGLIRPGEAQESEKPIAAVSPPDLVFPDDSLILEIARRRGQVSLETSFGCQFGACTFCPRDHRGEGWLRGQTATVVAMLGRVAPCGAVVSIVDEEFFGSEGLADPPGELFAAPVILEACRKLGISYELYTRLEQIFDRRRSLEWNLSRARLLATEAQAMRRIFLGVESGSARQLRRYGKGQTVQQIVDSLRVGSALGVPMEFGFITFDPLLEPDELAENIQFLARRDVVGTTIADGVEERVAAVESYLAGQRFADSGIPLYQHVAYMATELEVLAHSRYADHLKRRHPELLTGDYDESFARYGVSYRDERIAELAGWCRVWTEGMFTPIYEARMTARAAGNASRTSDAALLVKRYRDATFALMLHLTRYCLPELVKELQDITPPFEAIGSSPQEWLEGLSKQLMPKGHLVEFDLSFRGLRRER